MNIGLAVRAGSWKKKKRTGQDRTEKSHKKGYISPIWTEAPAEAIYIKSCVVCNILSVIICATFENEIFRGYYFTRDRIFHFPIDI